MILQHSGNAITLQSYMEANYYAYGNALFITEGDITNSLKFVLIGTREPSRPEIQHHGRGEE